MTRSLYSTRPIEKQVAVVVPLAINNPAGSVGISFFFQGAPRKKRRRKEKMTLETIGWEHCLSSASLLFIWSAGRANSKRRKAVLPLLGRFTATLPALCWAKIVWSPPLRHQSHSNPRHLPVEPFFRLLQSEKTNFLYSLNNDGHGRYAVVSRSTHGPPPSLPAGHAAAAANPPAPPAANVSDWRNEEPPSSPGGQQRPAGPHQAAHERLYGLVPSSASQDRPGQPQDAQLGNLQTAR